MASVSSLITQGLNSTVASSAMSECSNLKNVSNVTTSSGKNITKTDTVPVNQSLKDNVQANPIDAALVADNLKSDMANGVKSGPNGESDIDKCDPNWVADQVQSELDKNMNTVFGNTTTMEGSSGASDGPVTKPVDSTTTTTASENNEVLTQKRLNSSLKNVGYHDNGSLKSVINEEINIVDVQTGAKIPIYHFMDTARLARGGDTFSHTIAGQFLSNTMLKDFVRNGNTRYSPYSCVEALGLYNTDYIRQRVTDFTNTNDDLFATEDDSLRDDLTFRAYGKGGAGPIDTLNSDSVDFEYDGVHSDRLGVGLGECAVLNPPFQFNKRDDPRTNPMFPKIGRVYSTQIMNNWPIVMFQPGRLKYNTGFFKMLGLGFGAGVTESLIRTGGDGIRGAFSKLLNVASDAISVFGSVGSAIFGGGKIIEFKQSIKLYKQYLGFLVEDLAAIMGLTDASGKYNGSIKNLMLEKILPIHVYNGGLNKYYNTQFIPFRCSKDVTGAETFSNSTTTNPIMEQINSAAEEAEANETGGEGAGGLKDKAMNFLKRTGMKIAGNFSEQALVLSGRGRITLPDIFSSSSFSRSLTLDFKFHAPYGDAMCQFENEFLQLMILVAMGLPRQTGKLSYTSPFAVRVFIRNHIMINYGMIESISVTRGGDSNDWCPNGYPKTLSVSVSVKDMEPNISLPMASRGPLKQALEVMFPSTGISEYLGTIGGLTMDQMTHNWRKDHLRRASSVFTSSWRKWWDDDTFKSNVANSRIGSNIIGLISGSNLDVLNKIGDGNQDLYAEASKYRSSTGKQMFAASGFPYSNFSANGTEGKYKTFKEIQDQDKEALASLGNEIANGASNYL